MSKMNVIELELNGIGSQGQSVGRHRGKVVFVPRALPGEVVRVRIVEDRKRWARGELLGVLDPSRDRIDPPCPYYGACGGCHWQHASYAAQLAYKQQVVADQLRRTGHVSDPPVLPVRGMQEPWAYRNHAQFTLTGSGKLGFQAARSHNTVPVDRCLLLHPLLDELHAALDVDWLGLRRLSLRAGIHTGEQMVVLETVDDEIPELAVDTPLSCVLSLQDGTDLALIGQNVYHEALRERIFCISASSFFQVNTVQAETMLDIVETYLALEAEDVLLDVYCGVGTFGLSLRDQVARVIGIEEHPAAIRDAQSNAGDDDRVTLVEGKAETIMSRLDAGVTKAVIDPPRQGCKPQVIDALVRLAPQRIVYVSCNPSTLARDAALLVQRGYRLVEVQPVDVFPQTYHVEVLSLWQRTEACR